MSTTDLIRARLNTFEKSLAIAETLQKDAQIQGIRNSITELFKKMDLFTDILKTINKFEIYIYVERYKVLYEMGANVISVINDNDKIMEKYNDNTFKKYLLASREENYLDEVVLNTMNEAGGGKQYRELLIQLKADSNVLKEEIRIARERISSELKNLIEQKQKQIDDLVTNINSRIPTMIRTGIERRQRELELDRQRAQAEIDNLQRSLGMQNLAQPSQTQWGYRGNAHDPSYGNRGYDSQSGIRLQRYR